MSVRITRTPYRGSVAVAVEIVAPAPVSDITEYPTLDAAIAALPPSDPAQAILQRLKAKLEPNVGGPVEPELSMLARIGAFFRIGGK